MAKSKRESKKVISAVSAEAFNIAMGNYALSAVLHSKITAKMDADIVRIREKHAQPLADLAEAKDDAMLVILAYAQENKKTLFADKRSMETTYGTIGFRKGTPKLKTLPRFTWEKVLEKVKTILPDFIRKKEEVDKEGLLAARADEAVAPHLNAVGVYVDQDESFFIELKTEEVTA